VHQLGKTVRKEVEKTGVAVISNHFLYVFWDQSEGSDGELEDLIKYWEVGEVLTNRQRIWHYFYKANGVGEFKFN
jgi:hypothetical protein